MRCVLSKIAFGEVARSYFRREIDEFDIARLEFSTNRPRRDLITRKASCRAGLVTDTCYDTHAIQREMRAPVI